jgi:uncharacterized protein YbjT (DUF2867 family)
MSSPSPCILVVGATGNTGVGVVHTLVDSIRSSSRFANHRIVGLTRDTQGQGALSLSALPGVTMMEKDWKLIDSKWLADEKVERLFIASHNGVSHFTDESLFLNQALEARVEYVVRISTTRQNIGPTTPVFYARNHWAIETLLEQPEFDSMGWTSLQPNGFISLVTPALQGWLKAFRETGDDHRELKLMIDGDHETALIDPVEIGNIAGKLLLLDDVSPHRSRKYNLVGPTDATGKQAVALLEQFAKTSVKKVVYRDVSWIEHAKAAGTPENVLSSLMLAPRAGYLGACSTKNSPTSPEIMELCPPKNGGLEMWREALAGM